MALLLLGAGCGGPEALTLPEAPLDRAATCGIVAAAEARLATADVKAPLALEAQGRVVHYAMLAASDGEEFQGETASAVSRRMAELQDEVTGGKWQDLAPACRAAYPAAAKAEVELPAGRLDAQLACAELADFLLTALAEQERDYPKELAEYRRLRRELNDALGPGLRARTGTAREAQQTEKSKALAKAAALGSPVAVMGECGKRFG